VSKFKFTGKERDEESQYDYFGARYYDARIGRWGQVEPLLNNLPDCSPYSYGLNNPIKILDVDGNWPREGMELHTTKVEDIKANFNEIVEKISSGYEKFLSGDFKGAKDQMLSNIIESPSLIGGLIPGDFTTDFINPVGLARGSVKMLRLTKEISIEKQAIEIAKHINKNSINLGGETLDLIDSGSKLGYSKGHYNKLNGEYVGVPHVQKNLFSYNREKGIFQQRKSTLAIPATNEHIQRALDIINNITKGF